MLGIVGAARMTDFRGVCQANVPTRSLAYALAFLILLVAIVVVSAAIPSPLARHMFQHAVTMNLVAPVIVWILTDHWSRRVSVLQLVLLTALQIGLLWAWHSPTIFVNVHADGLLTGAMHVSLLVAAVLFWRSIVNASRARPFWSVAALLVTGKLYCLYGVLLVFASRQLFADAGHHHHAITSSDQQLAGLIMISACPLTYIAAAVAIVVRWMQTIDAAARMEQS